MKNRSLLLLALLLFAALSLAVQQFGKSSSGSALVLGAPEMAAASKSPLVGDWTLVRTPDAEFLNEAPVNPPGEPVASGNAAEPGGEAAEAPADAVAAAKVGNGVDGDAKEVKELEGSGGDGKDFKEFKEIIDPKGLPPIADGVAAGGPAGGGGGGGGGFGGGGGGGAIPGEVMAFEEEIEVGGDSDTIFQYGGNSVTERTIIRTVMKTTPPVTPVPEAGSALSGLAAVGCAIAAMLRRSRAA